MSQNELQRVVAEMLSYKDLTPEQVEWARRIKAESDRIEAAQAVAPGGGEAPNPVQLWGDTGWHELNGWKLVPIEPTPAMCVAGFLSDTPDGFDIETPADAPSLVYRAMLAAAPASEAKGQDEVKFAKELQRFYPWVVTTGNGGVAAEMVPAEDGGYVLYDEAATKLNAISSLLSDMRPKPAASSAVAERVCMECGTSYTDGKACPTNHDAEQEQAGELQSMADRHTKAADTMTGLGGLSPTDERVRLHLDTAALLRRAARVEVTDAERSWHNAFKNFHHSLCKRFGYCHDEIDWSRDQVSLEEHIASKLALAEQDARRLDFMAHHGISFRQNNPEVFPDTSWYMVAPYHTGIPCVDDRTRFASARTAIDAAIAAGEVGRD